jgi:Ser/Thr protein kinase RdoA (MazF antagonist)
MSTLPPPLASGRQAQLFPWTQGRVLKLFRTNDPAEAQREFGIALLAYQRGARTPQPFEVVQVEDRSGIVFARVDGPPLADSLRTQPWRVLQLARQFAALHHTVHACAAPEFPAAKSALTQAIANRPELSPATRQAVLDLLASLPDGEVLLHGDFHPRNVLVETTALTLVDWPNAAHGFPIADVARTTLILRTAASPGPQPTLARLLEERFVNLFRTSYIRAYFKHSPHSPASLARWEVVLAAHRLEDGISEETEMLVNFVQAGLYALKREN